MKAIALISGGLDSLVALAIAIKECDEVIALHSYYGQVTQLREWRAARGICQYYGIERITVALNHLRIFGGSALFARDAIKEGVPADKVVPDTYVPFRNGNLLSAAASLAETKKAERIYIGVVEEDSSGYPDCREEFIKAFNKAVVLGISRVNIKIETPLIHMNKGEIIFRGLHLKVPFNLSWSCYKNNDRACGVCESCLLRLRGFHAAGIKDPITYAPHEHTDEAKAYIEGVE